jgi:hypothetical protein
LPAISSLRSYASPMDCKLSRRCPRRERSRHAAGPIPRLPFHCHQ